MKAVKKYNAGGKGLKKLERRSIDAKSRSNFMAARGRAAEHMRGSAQMARQDDKPSDTLRKRKYKKGGKLNLKRKRK